MSVFKFSWAQPYSCAHCLCKLLCFKGKRDHDLQSQNYFLSVLFIDKDAELYSRSL